MKSISMYTSYSRGVRASLNTGSVFVFSTSPPGAVASSSHSERCAPRDHARHVRCSTSSLARSSSFAKSSACTASTGSGFIAGRCPSLTPSALPSPTRTSTSWATPTREAVTLVAECSNLALRRIALRRRPFRPNLRLRPLALGRQRRQPVVRRRLARVSHDLALQPLPPLLGLGRVARALSQELPRSRRLRAVGTRLRRLGALLRRRCRCFGILHRPHRPLVVLPQLLVALSLLPRRSSARAAARHAQP
mmetsp:Transcript_38102/g.126206  ORF Transcript_38102/g.126206 Transcript_38102/m.126206 type:complete len:250 (-) Transcript_38102:22-771(-)